MTVITISREYGSGGSEISQQVAKALAYTLIDKNVIEKVLKQYGLIEYDDLYQASSFWARFDSSNIEMMKMLNQSILAFASRDNSVILGRGGFAILRGFNNVLNVRIQMPLNERAQQVMKLENLPNLATAEELVKQNDITRDGFIRTFYDVRSDDASLYDLVIDTSRVPPDMATNWIVEAARSLARIKPQAGRTTREIEVDPVLAQTIAEVQPV